MNFTDGTPFAVMSAGCKWVLPNAKKVGMSSPRCGVGALVSAPTLGFFGIGTGAGANDRNGRADHARWAPQALLIDCPTRRRRTYCVVRGCLVTLSRKCNKVSFRRRLHASRVATLETLHSPLSLLRREPKRHAHPRGNRFRFRCQRVGGLEAEAGQDVAHGSREQLVIRSFHNHARDVDFPELVH
jgi:hypothetical protein